MESHSLQQFIEQMPAAIAIFDRELRYLAVSHRHLSELAWLFSTEVLAPDKVMGRTFFEISPEAPARWGDVFARVLAGEDLAQEEDFVPRKDGRAVWLRWAVKPWRNAYGRIDGALLFGEVVTQQVEIRHALAESESRARATFENAAVGIAHISSDLRWLRANETLCRIVGWPIKELVTKSLQDIVHPDDLEAELGYVQQIRDGKIDKFEMEKRCLRKDDGFIWTLLALSCVRKSDRSIDYFVGVIQDISARKRAEKELADSEARFRATFDNVAVGITHVAPDGKFLRFNKALSRLIGWPADELITKSVWEITHPDDLALELAQFKLLEDGSIDSYSVEKRDLRKDGTTVWIRLTRSCVRKSDGSVDYFVAVVEDISARKHAEEQLNLLMRECNHRAKNMLGLVQVIARQTAAGSPEDFVGRFAERIEALAANQDLLARNQQQGADLEDLVRTHLAYFADLVGSRITAIGPKLNLNAAAAQAIGLALHELATNAGKYGALSTDTGRVDIGWAMTDDTFTMSWTERSGPAMRPPERKGFGSMVIDSMTRQTFGGEVQLDYAPSGLGWRLTCPAANALEGTVEPGSQSSNAPGPAKP
jgi:PAS domain S-box-containing protein